MTSNIINLMTEDEKLLLRSRDIISEKIKEYLDFLFSNTSEEKYFEVRILKLNGSPESRIFKVSKTDKAAFYIWRKMNLDFGRKNEIKGIYVTINTSKEIVEGALKDENIDEIINFPIDLDAFHTTPPSEQEAAAVREAVKKAAEEYFGRRGLAYMITSSGFGFHVYVKLKPLEMNGDKEAAYREVARRIAEDFESEVLKHIDKKYASYVKNSVDKSVYNPSRIMRVPWTINRREINGIVYETLSRVLIKKDGAMMDLSTDIENELSNMNKVAEKLYIENKDSVSLNSEEKDKLVEILKKYWQPGQRHNLALGLAAFFYFRGVKYDDALEIIKRVCKKTGDTEADDRERAVKDTYFNAVYKNYRSYLSDELIFELNSVLKSFYQRALKKKDTATRGITTALRVMNDEFDLLEYLKDHTTDIIKEIDEKSTRITFKVTFVEEKTGQEATFVLKHTAKSDKSKMFDALNEDFMAYFSIYIVDPTSIITLSREEKKVFRAKIAQIMLEYYAFVTKNAREVVSEEFEEVKDAFFDVIELYMKGIVVVNERSELTPARFYEILSRNYMVYAESENRIYFIPKLLDYADVKAFTRNLYKFLKKKQVVTGRSWRKDNRTSVSLGDTKKETVYFINAEKFFELLKNEDVMIRERLEIDEYIEKYHSHDLDEQLEENEEEVMTE